MDHLSLEGTGPPTLPGQSMVMPCMSSRQLQSLVISLYFSAGWGPGGAEALKICQRLSLRGLPGVRARLGPGPQLVRASPLAHRRSVLLRLAGNSPLRGLHVLPADQDSVPPPWAFPQAHRGRASRLAVEAVAARERPLAADGPMTQSRQAQGTDRRPGDLCRPAGCVWQGPAFAALAGCRCPPKKAQAGAELP